MRPGDSVNVGNAKYREIVRQLILRRRQLGLRQADLSRWPSGKGGDLSAWEAGLKSPSISGLFMWAEALGVEIGIVSIEEETDAAS